MGLFSKDPFSKISIKIKLPLGFILLFLCVMSVGGYFMTNSVYGPLDREIRLRLQSETMALATLFDKQLESLGRRAEDFSSDGFIRTQVESIISSTSPQESHERLLDHLRVNKLPIVQEFVDLHIYDLNQKKSWDWILRYRI